MKPKHYLIGLIIVCAAAIGIFGGWEQVRPFVAAMSGLLMGL